MSEDLVSRLLEQHGKMDGYGGGPRLRNPDGPEAVAYIADLENDLSEGSFYKKRDIDAFQARIAALEAELETCRKYRDAYRQCDEIATADVRRLETENAKLREALKPFARIASEPAVKNARKSRKSYIHTVLPVASLENARAALAETEGE